MLYLFYLFIFVMMFCWVYCGNGGSHTAKRQWVKYGLPAVCASVVLGLVVFADWYQVRSERLACAELTDGVLRNGVCYKRVEGPVYIEHDRMVIRP